MDDAELESQFTAETLALENSGAGMPFVFKPSEGWMLLSVLQLALRHPFITDAAVGAPAVHAFAEGLARNIEGRLCKTPAMQEVARRGWEPVHDMQTPAAHEPVPPAMTKPEGKEARGVRMPAEPAAERVPAAAPPPEPPSPKRRSCRRTVRRANRGEAMAKKPAKPEPKKKRKPERTPDNKAVEAPENKAIPERKR